MSTYIGDLTGPGHSTQFAIGATDLGIPRRMPDGSGLFVFGDTFKDAKVGGADWRSPVALRAFGDTLPSKVTWTECVHAEGGDPAHADQLVPYQQGNEIFSTKIPTDLVVWQGVAYLHVMVCQGLGNVKWTEVWQSHDSGRTWTETGVRWNGDLLGGYVQMITWETGPIGDPYIYMMSTGFQRDRGVMLHRVKKSEPGAPAVPFEKFESWGWDGTGWGWGRGRPTPVLDGPMWRLGEMSLRRVPISATDQRQAWVLTYFDEGRYRIASKSVASLEDNWYDAPTGTLVSGTSWPLERNDVDNTAAQLYGGYIIPGSTCDEMYISVSQWNTGTGWPYHVMQYKTSVPYPKNVPSVVVPDPAPPADPTPPPEDDPAPAPVPPGPPAVDLAEILRNLWSDLIRLFNRRG